MQTSKLNLGLRIWLIATLFFVYIFFLRTLIGSINLQLQHSFHLGAVQFNALATAYYISYGLMQIPAGLLLDRFGCRFILSIACACCATAVWWFSASTSFTGLLLSRFCMGLFSAFAFIGLISLTQQWFPRRIVASMVGVAQFIGTLGPILAAGPLVSVVLAQHDQWQIPLQQVAFGGYAIAILLFLWVKTQPNSNKHSLLAKPTTPLISRLNQLFRDRQVWFIALFTGSSYVFIALFGAIWGTSYLQAQGFSQQQAANFISLSWFNYALACPLLGMLSDYLQRRRPVLVGCAVLAIGLSLIFLLPLGRLPVTLTYVLLSALGWAAAGQSIGFVAMLEHVSMEQRSAATGFANSMITVFDASVPSLIAYVIQQHANGQHLHAADFVSGLSLLPLVALLSFFMALLIRDVT